MPKILVADDNSNIQKMVTLAFKGEGIDVVAVGNGEAAVKKTIEIVPDLVLADIFMPVRSGYEVCEFLKQDPRFSHIPVVLLAGAFDPFDEREAQRVGADGVLKKPFVPPDPLITLVKGLLAKNAERLVAVAVPVQSTTVSAQSSATTPEASASSAPAFVPPPFVPTPVPPSPDPSVKGDEYPEDEIELGTTAPPMRDFSIPVAPVESESHGGADAFGSMLDTSPLGTMMPPIRKLGEPETDAEVGEDRDIQPASAHTAFEGFSPWRASASTAGVVEEIDTTSPQTPEAATEHENQFMPSPKDLMGRVWEIDPTMAANSPEETVIEPRDEISPLTHSIQHVTSVREKAEPAIEAPAPADSNEPAEPGQDADSKASDWRSAFAQVPEEAAQIVEAPAPSMSPWRMSTPPAENFQSDRLSETASFAEVESVADDSSTPEVSSAPEVEAAAETTAEFVATEQPETIADTETASATEAEADSAFAMESTSQVAEEVEPAIAHSESFDAPSTEVDESQAAHVEDQTQSFSSEHHEQSEDEHHSEIEQHAETVEELPSHPTPENVETSDWIAALPAHLSPEDTTTIARSVVEQLAPSAVESIATSFPVPTGTQTDLQVVEEIVARVVERMQPQILEIITREVLRPVVEALVRRQLEQKLPE